ncbi:MAG: class I SAM-dependent methyltransferase [Candidatus Thorarchaeota archaeon]
MVFLEGRNFKPLNKKKEIISRYDSSANFYDKRYKSIQEEKYRILLDNCELKEKLILDIGCGTGLLLEYIIKLKQNQEILKLMFIAVDISGEMVSEFKKKILTIKDSSQIELLLADIENLPFRDNSFNLIFSVTSFQNLPNILKGIQESLRITKSFSPIKFSILRKKLNLNRIINLLRPYVKNLEIVNNKDMEDVIIQGELIKESI